MAPTIYERVGGEAFFVALVDRFYDGVATDALVRPMYPEDLEGPRERLALFLAQSFGGPHRYDALRGEPRLRLRHLEFPIDQAAREAWLSHMRAALAASVVEEEIAAAMLDYFERTSQFLVNRGGLSIGGSP